MQRSFVFEDGPLPTVRFESTEPDCKVRVNEAIVLEYRMARGDTCRYSTLIKNEQSINGIASEPGQMSMIMHQNCGCARSDGTFEISVVVEGQPQTIEMIMARTGKILETSVENQINQTTFPTHPVFVGESWRQQRPFVLQNPFTQQSRTVPLTYTYLLSDVREQEGHRLARIQVQCAPTVFTFGSEGTLSFTATGETIFAIDQGTLLSSRVSTQSTLAAANDVVETNIELSVSLEQ